MASPEANLTRRWRALLLLVLFALGLACLALPETAESGVATEWVRRYNGQIIAIQDITPVAIALDGQGNIFVTGSSGKGDLNYLTIKYSPHGQCLWARRYHGPGDGSALAKAMAVDTQGNVYVTGYSTGAGTYWDYTTVKYSPDGQRLWVRRYNGPLNGEDIPNAMAVDSQGNIYITGSSWGVGSGRDFATIKYNSDGERLWVRRYKGAENDAINANAITVDKQGNVYVFGIESWLYYTTIKYSPDGQRLWVVREQGPMSNEHDARSIALDALGNVYISGGAWGVFLTIKYSPEGKQLWTRRDGIGGYSKPRSMTVDPQGNAYIIGESVTIKYSPDGQQLWLKGYAGGLAIALDAPGNVYVTGHGSTIKYNPSGEESWVQREIGMWTKALALDGQGNVYVTGSSEGESGDFLTIKYIQTPRTGR